MDDRGSYLRSFKVHLTPKAPDARELIREVFAENNMCPLLYRYNCSDILTIAQSYDVRNRVYYDTVVSHRYMCSYTCTYTQPYTYIYMQIHININIFTYTCIFKPIVKWMNPNGCNLMTNFARVYRLTLAFMSSSNTMERIKTWYKILLCHFKITRGSDRLNWSITG